MRLSRFTLLFTCLFLFSFNKNFSQSSNHPNILWISCEDISPHFSFYGDSTIVTPNLDALAKKGIIYTNAFTTAGVCSPSRCAIITGVNQVTAGGHNMRTLNNTFPEKTGLPKSYSIVPPPEIKAFPEFLRANGYYCTNNEKTDYQFEAPPTVWDESGKNATWKNRKPGQPFFAVVNYVITHESQVWVRKDLPLHADPEKIKVPPYYPDTKTVRSDMARFYSNIADMDSLIGNLLWELDEDGLTDSTIIFFWSDHGDGLPFAKRELYDRGLWIPLVVKFPDGKDAGTRDDRLISAIDLGPTVLSLAGVRPPDYMQGRAFLGTFKDDEHPYIFAARDRVDSEYDRVRAVRDKHYKYIRNFNPELPLYMDIEYRLNQPMMKEILDMKKEGKLDSIQLKWFVPNKPTEELYDLEKDTFELNNLANDPEYKQVLLRMREVMNTWIDTVKDLGSIPEKLLIKKMWNGKDSPPVTREPKINIVQNQVTISSNTKGASIGYKIIEKGSAEPEGWQVYTAPFPLQSNVTIKAVAQRIGYEKSKETVMKK
ncbi:sulfatase-like hydrolase/transferase [soil metagenome]